MQIYSVNISIVNSTIIKWDEVYWVNKYYQGNAVARYLTPRITG